MNILLGPLKLFINAAIAFSCFPACFVDFVNCLLKVSLKVRFFLATSFVLHFASIATEATVKADLQWLVILQVYSASDHFYFKINIWGIKFKENRERKKKHKRIIIHLANLMWGNGEIIPRQYP